MVNTYRALIDIFVKSLSDSVATSKEMIHSAVAALYLHFPVRPCARVVPLGSLHPENPPCERLA
jgi:hypothetical protein